MKKFFKSFLVIVLAVVLTLTLVACKGEQPTTLTDRAGNSVTIPTKIDKIISFAPSITEVLVDLGLGDKIIAVTTVDNTAGLSSDIVKFDFMSPDTEALLKLETDILFASSMTMAGGANDPFKLLSDSGVCVCYIPTSNTISDIYLDLEFLGKATNTEKKAKSLADNMKKEIEAISDLAKKVTTKKSVYFEISAAPYMYSTGKNTYLNEMITLIGATNILSDLDGWVSISDENILAKNPDVILTNVNYIEKPIDEILSRNGWNAVNAVANKEVYQMDNNSTSLSNHNIVKGMKEMAKAIYPEIYKDVK